MISESLIQLYENHRGKVSDKWHLYLTEYDRVLSMYRDSQVRLFEIGVQNGGSMEIWSRYFPNAQTVLGCDIDPSCAHLEFEDARIEVRVGDANSDTVQNWVSEKSPVLDIVIDDGSHTSGDIIKSFTRYFPCVSNKGVYIVEDLHCSYWESFEGGLFDPKSAISFFKSLIDAINHDHWGIELDVERYLQYFSDRYDIELTDFAFTEIHSIEFFDSVCVIRKNAATENSLGARIVAGQQEAVVRGHMALSDAGALSTAPSQDLNVWSTLEPSLANKLAIIDACESQLRSHKSKINALSHRVGEAELSAEVKERQVLELEKAIRAYEKSLSWRIMSPVRWIASFFSNFSRKIRED